MVNRNNSGITLPRAQRGFLRSARAEAPGGGQMLVRALQKGSALAGVVAEDANRRLDDQAAREGQQAGKHAGSDPSFDFATAPDPSTIRGNNFERAAVRTAINRLDATAQSAIGKLAIDHASDPAALQSKINDYKSQLLGGLPDILKPDVAAQVDRWAMGAVSKATINAHNLQTEADRAASISMLGRRIDSLSLVARAEADPDRRSVALDQELTALENLLVEYGPQGAFSFNGRDYAADPGRAGHFKPEAIVKLYDRAVLSAAEARATAPLDYLSSVQEVKDYGEELIASEIEKGAQSGLGASGLEVVANKIDARIRELEHRATKEAAAVRYDLRDLNDLVMGGHKVDPTRIEATVQKALVLGDLDLATDAADLKSLAAFSARARTMNPADLSEEIEARRQVAGGAITVAQAREIETAERIYGAMIKGLQTDPLGFAAQAETVAVQPLDFAKPLPDQLKLRAKQADDVAAYYGVNTGLLRPDERDHISLALSEGDSSQAVAIMKSIHQGFGGRAVEAFREFKDKDPSFAFLGGLSGLGPAQQQTAILSLSGQRALSENDDLLPIKADFNEALDEELGTAFGFAPATRSQIIQTTKGLIASQRLRGALDLDDPASAIGAAVHQAAGGWTDIGGIDRGGIGTYNGREIVVPINMARDEFEDTVGNMSDDDLMRLSVGHTAPIFADGTVLKADDLDDVFLVNKGPGQYWISVTDPAISGPSLLGGGDENGLYVLDLTGGGQ